MSEVNGTQTGFFLAHNQVNIGARIREDYKGKDWKEFKDSFLTVLGQMQPIIVEHSNAGYELVYGERRWRAIGELYEEGKTVQNLPPGMIWAATRENMPARTRKMMEFGENFHRSDFTYKEKAKYIREFHELMVEEYGKETWTQELTAYALKLSPASISLYLRVEEAIKNDPSVAKATTMDAAVKRLKVSDRMKVRHDEAKKDDNDSFQRASTVLHRGDSREWLPTVEDESVDLVIFDPPWGDDVSYKVQENHEGFDDSTEEATDIMESMFPHLFRILKADRFCVFWFRTWADEQMASLAKSNGFNLDFTRTPCIWIKPDKVVDQNRIPEKSLTEGYEKFFLLRKGDPLFHDRRPNNVFTYDRVPVASLIHPTEKPIGLQSDIIRLCTVPGELVVDPCAGSSSSLDAALRNNRKARGGEKVDTYWERGISRLAEYLKTFKEG